MGRKKELSREEIEKIYQIIKECHEKYLKIYGVKLPKLVNKKGKYTKEALVLVYLARNYPETEVVSKEDLTKFIRRFYSGTPDVQQARHLAAQKGWFIASGTRGNAQNSLKYGEYRLISLEEPYPGFKKRRIEINEHEWESLKDQYDYRCATCGSKEGEYHFHWKNTRVKLQKAHMDPNKPLVAGNIIPQCQICNRAYKDYWVFDKKGRVIKLANPKIINRSDKKVQWEIYKILYKKFKGKDPKGIKT
jgi:predicted restriction endonuclease